METERDNFEYALSQYADGTLSELDRRTIEDRLMSDAEGRLLVSDFARVDALLRDSRELPDIDFDAFAVTISRALEAEDAHAAAPLRMWAMSPGRWMGGLAAAAAVAIAAFVGLHNQPAARPVATGVGTGVGAGTAQISGPTVEVANASANITIGVGPSDALARRGDRLSLGDEAISPPSPKVVISAAGRNATGDVRPY